MALSAARFTATADRMLAKAKAGGLAYAAILRRQTSSGPAYNPTITPADHACTAMVESYSNREIDGSRVLATDKKVLLAKGALTIEPTTSDKLVIGGIEHSIIRVEPLAPGGAVVCWTLQVRR